MALELAPGPWVHPGRGSPGGTKRGDQGFGSTPRCGTGWTGALFGFGGDRQLKRCLEYDCYNSGSDSSEDFCNGGRASCQGWLGLGPP